MGTSLSAAERTELVRDLRAAARAIPAMADHLGDMAETFAKMRLASYAVMLAAALVALRCLMELLVPLLATLAFLAALGGAAALCRAHLLPSKPAEEEEWTWRRRVGGACSRALSALALAAAASASAEAA